MLALAALTFATPACAQGLFDMIFNGDRYAPRPSRGYAPQPGNAYADPSNPSDRPVYGPSGDAPQVSHGGGRVAYCVRLCDGRYFPMQRHANATSIQLCNAFCPAAKTQVFNGSQIDHAVAANGARYANLDNAFVYREKIVAGLHLQRQGCVRAREDRRRVRSDLAAGRHRGERRQRESRADRDGGRKERRASAQ